MLVVRGKAYVTRGVLRLAREYRWTVAAAAEWNAEI